MASNFLIIDGRVLAEFGRKTVELLPDHDTKEFIGDDGQYYRIDGPVVQQIKGVPPKHWTVRISEDYN